MIIFHPICKINKFLPSGFKWKPSHAALEKSSCSFDTTVPASCIPLYGKVESLYGKFFLKIFFKRLYQIWLRHFAALLQPDPAAH